MPLNFRRVILESPYRGEFTTPNSSKAGRRAINLAYARECMLDSIQRGEAPFASHLLYTQVLDDDNPDDRILGISAGQSWFDAAEAMVVYDDFGITSGMHGSITQAKSRDMTIEYRKLYKADEAEADEDN